MLATVGAVVLGRAVLTPSPTSALSGGALAAPAAPQTPAGGRAHRPGSRASSSRHQKASPSSPPHPTQSAGPTRSAAPTQAASPKPSPRRRQVTGQAYDVGYGVVQVRVTLVGSHLTDVTALSLPQGGHSSDVSSYAAPILRKEALAAQSANIDAVSGASYTSAGYARSLQSALDAARQG